MRILPYNENEAGSGNSELCPVPIPKSRYLNGADVDGSNERSNNGYLIDPDSELERAKNRGRKQGKWHWVGMFIGGVICIGAALIVFSLLAWMCAMSIDLAIHAWRNL